jgi:hypothetical protein
MTLTELNCYELTLALASQVIQIKLAYLLLPAYQE